jgi:electron transfer flavoprotein alpha/beta subunit
MKAKKKPVTLLTAGQLPGLEASDAGVRFESISPPPPRPDCKFIDGEPPQMATELIRLLREEAKVL